ncbi:YrhC family protein [Fictibacillus sp. WQ 8-8]|uniref:YrhC family protein n=1 Tax=unclassified Fictibacillus TaxID=2644029 RepID=UPI0006A7ECAF|nr:MULTISPECIES: YrhC family protein [unclassified Fictibacillus]MCQ6266369.1 YrhC family protein [Fictibacillus sp. WQ 8-8]MED2972410.1 YrhC family protein [Fictibacillus sp. B-59209]UZJ80491.1 YrhC family protein [Fictibacillus sp. KU28468]SFD63546.1 YrhC-like protein [Bacillus sp. OV194]
MDSKVIQDIKVKIQDYQHYGIILLSLSSFLYLGTVIPFAGKDTADAIVCGATSMTGLGFTALMYYQAKRLKKRLQEIQ